MSPFVDPDLHRPAGHENRLRKSLNASGELRVYLGSAPGAPTAHPKPARSAPGKPPKRPSREKINIRDQKHGTGRQGQALKQACGWNRRTDAITSIPSRKATKNCVTVKVSRIAAHSHPAGCAASDRRRIIPKATVTAPFAALSSAFFIVSGAPNLLPFMSRDKRGSSSPELSVPFDTLPPTSRFCTQAGQNRGRTQDFPA